MDAPLSPQILATHLSPADPVADASFLAAHAADSTGAAVSPADGAASAAAFDGTAPADDSRLPASPLTDVAEGTVPLIAGSAADSTDAVATADDAGAPPTDAAEGTVPPVAEAAVNATVPSSEAGALAVPPTDVVGKTVPPVAGAAAGTDVDAAPADDVGASATAFEDAAGKTLVSGTASVAGGERGFLPCSPSPPDVWILRDGKCSGWGCRACQAGGKAWDLSWCW